MNDMTDCIFCKIVRKEIPSTMVYENHKTVAFMDIKPTSPGHVLVVPKEHHADFASTPADQLGDIAAVAQKIARAATEAFGAQGFNIGVNIGRAAGQLVDHMHLHVIPRYDGDGLELWHGKPYAEGEMERLADKLKTALS